MAPKTMEPFWWSLFSVGGVVAALLVPVHIVLHAIAIPLGLIPAKPERMAALAAHPLVKLYFFVLIVLPLYHWAHRCQERRQSRRRAKYPPHQGQDQDRVRGCRPRKTTPRCVSRCDRSWQ